MDSHRTEIHHHPASRRVTLRAAFEVVFFTHLFDHILREGVDHAVTGAVAEDEVIGEIDYFLQVQ